MRERSSTNKNRLIIVWIACSIILIGSSIVLVGWLFDRPMLTRISPFFPTMKPNTAFGFLASAVGLICLLLNYKKLTQIIGVILCISFILTLLEYVFSINLSIDQAFITDTVTTIHPGRPSVATATSFTLLGLYFTLHSLIEKQAVILDGLNIIALFFPLLALIGYLTNPKGLFQVPIFSTMALHTVAGFLLLYLTLPFAYAQSYIHHSLFGHSPGSKLFKRLLIPIFAMPLAIGFIYNHLVVRHVLEANVALALCAATFMIACLAALIRAAFNHNRLFAHFNALSEDHLQQQIEMSVILDSAAGALIIFSEQGHVITVNSGVSNILGWDKQDLQSMDVWQLVIPKYRRTVLTAIARFHRQDKQDRESQSLWLFARCKDNNELAVLVSVTKHQLKNQAVYGVLVLDAQRLIDHIQRLNHDVNVDPLTHIQNRRALENELQKLKESGETSDLNYAIAILDIDHFKEINDKYGHHAGDVAIQTFTLRVRNCLRYHDQIYRFGGDEFVIIAKAKSELELHAIFERVRATIAAAPVSYKRHHFQLSCSIGICAAVGGGAQVDQCFTLADQALYRAKQNGRNQLQLCNNSSFIKPHHDRDLMNNSKS